MATDEMPVTKRLAETEEEVYSNIDHVFNSSVAEQLESGEKFAQHAGWNFCGYVYRDGRGWHEEVWVHGSPVETISGESAEEVIRNVNEEYGSE